MGRNVHSSKAWSGSDEELGLNYNIHAWNGIDEYNHTLNSSNHNSNLSRLSFPNTGACVTVPDTLGNIHQSRKAANTKAEHDSNHTFPSAQLHFQ
jgi:hypothetical protein